MKNCPYCKVNIGGNLTHCPLCQNSLLGEGERDYWPSGVGVRRNTIAFKIVLFSVLVGIIVSFAMDYVFIGRPHFHFSPIVFMWCEATGWLLESSIKAHRNILRIMFAAVIILSVLCLLTEYYITVFADLPYYGISSGYVIPILCCVNMAANFVLSFVDKHFTDHAMIFMIINIFIGIIPWVFLFFYKGMPPLTWSISLVLSTISFAALLVFRRRIVINEFKKRFHV